MQDLSYHVFNGAPSSQYEWVLKVGLLSLLLGVDPQEAQLLPQFLHEVVHVQLHVTTRVQRAMRSIAGRDGFSHHIELFLYELF